MYLALAGRSGLERMGRKFGPEAQTPSGII